MRGLGSAVTGARPHEISIVVVDVRTRIDVSVGREEDVSRRDEVWS